MSKHNKAKLKELVEKSASDNEAMSILIDKFEKLLRKHARSLRYEDAYDDMLVSFITLIRGFNTDLLDTCNDGAIVQYITVSMKNEFIKLSKRAKQNSTVPFSSLDEPFLYRIEVNSAKADNYSLQWDDLRNLLTVKEFEILRFLESGYSVEEIAKRFNSSRQAVNQSKNRAFQKLRAKWGDVLD